MQYFDAAVAVVLAVFFLNGIRKGFFHEIFGLVGVLAGVLLGILLAGPLTMWLTGRYESLPATGIHIASFTTLFAAGYLGAHFLANLFKSLSEKLLLNWLNRLLGGVVGALKGVLVVSMLTMFASFLPLQKSLSDYQKDSFFHVPLFHLVPEFYRAFGSPDDLPEQVRDILGKTREELLKMWETYKPDSSDDIEYR